MRVLPLVLLVLVAGCDDDPPEEAVPVAEAPEEPAAVDTPEPEAEAPVAEADRPERPERPATVQARAARAAQMSTEERARMRTRNEQLREGRRLGRAGQHAEALTAFEAALEVMPEDMTVRCEAGYQALQLERYDAAKQHLRRALSRAGVPRTVAMCMYNLGRALEATDEIARAVRQYEGSLELRPNRVVRERLAGLRARLEADDEANAAESDYDYGFEDDAGPNVDTLRTEGPFENLEALAATGCVAGEERYSADPSTVDFRELAICQVDGQWWSWTYVVARSDRGWQIVDQVGSTDMHDSYGHCEIGEEVALVTFVDGRARVVVDGSCDENPDEAGIYWQCESEVEGDEDADLWDCMRENGSDDLAPPDQWSEAYFFAVQDGRVALVDRETLQAAGGDH